MNLQFWMGTTIGVIVALLIILAIVHFAGNANAKKAKEAGDRNFAALQQRNAIGRAQCNALQVIGNALMNQQETAVEMRDLLAKQYGTQDDADDYNDEPGIHPDKLATMTRHKESWQAETIRLENDLTRTRAERDRLKIHADHLLDCIDTPPEPNCSCHLSAPCCDCTDHSGLREAIANMKAAIGAVESRAE